MKKELEKTISLYILNQFGITLNNNVINTSIINNNFLLNNNVQIFEEELESKLYGVQTTLSGTNINIFCVKYIADVESNYIILFDLENLPKYALCCDFDTDNFLLYYKLNNFDWIHCDTFLQASFLAGIEHVNTAHTYYNVANISDFNKSDLINFIKAFDKDIENK